MKQQWFIGFYGCSIGDRVVSVRPPLGTEMKPHVLKTWEVTCPACGDVHRVKPMWRAARLEEWEKAEIQLSVESEIDPEGKAKSKRKKGRAWDWPGNRKPATP